MLRKENITVTVGTRELSAVFESQDEYEPHVHPLILFIHGFVGNKVGEHRLFVKAAQHFHHLGYATLRFDFSGCGESSGHYQDVTVTKQIEELKAIINHVKHVYKVKDKNLILLGHSLGGGIAALTANEIRGLQKVILWAPVANPYEEILSITGESAETLAKSSGLFDFSGFLLSEEFFNDLKKHKPLENIQHYQGDLLVFHGERDQDISVQNVTKYKEAFLTPHSSGLFSAEFISFADHTFTNSNWEQELFQKTSEHLIIKA
ncbi:hypothetical protein AJ85_15440 [Alkalihalobacillus alcalophilus ATCC 27647 = CGMCC 1.3604]|uniref:Serine aminopeptidase S33 domain-containing protein n=1 Tax=Alkalihalobacillus alcalophilus ATCC 27647 = CGMCC 1.3604 TaxID=1218173 RepID=A0A094YYJ9_ALKAL|nr:alpha/beta hydrolase [Alkalihalobacillus alcalophilus]KGA98617.1 hypothetical protein BALCAV_0203780 [Alkalihalobacillus alcalophilus ATCC 27647 = CGMCC 1.3604]MED1560460.1 alpha/beta fold hydrolase [Alkalihalobacillus alcalophilus]THG89738.1 hypothetical protein AJ85_15440 [Alkalihalobacillus alcalophilus ATCC 27647 = CGMCC 1.3604]